MGTSERQRVLARRRPREKRLELFEAHRGRLFGIAYRMLGSREDAEELVQEAYLRWHRTDEVSVRLPEAYLVAVITRLSIDRLRLAAVKREVRVDWWKEEQSVGDDRVDAGRRVELASELSLAFRALLERLTPQERGAFLLREVFGADYAEIAGVLEKNETACRQIVHRARKRARGDRSRGRESPEVSETLVTRCVMALQASDKDALLGLVTGEEKMSAHHTSDAA